MTSRKESPIIEVKHLSKEYEIGMDQTYKTLSESVTNAVRHPIRTLRGLRAPKETFWALKDITFEVERGEVLGIIGRNGAGKSTLLKILSRITYPTEGEAILRGRVGSLLEVGTGFHPELTGRENIYFNGAILGMKKREIDEKFDEIVKFSGVERFLDTPVKRYSSGMQVRLAFSVAAHLEPEILLVDEVLAVGDAEFQKKCLGKMGEVASEGRTVLFVSHNMNAIEQLCNNCILIDKGMIKEKGSNVREITRNYLFPKEEEREASCWINNGCEYDNPYFKPTKIFLRDKYGNQLTNPIPNDNDIWLQIEGYIEILDPALEIGYSIYTNEGNILYWSYFNDQEVSKWPVLSKGKNILLTRIPQHFLNEEIYLIELIVSLRCRLWITTPGKNSPEIKLQIQGGLSDSPYWTTKRPGVIAPILLWKNVDA